MRLTLVLSLALTLGCVSSPEPENVLESIPGVKIVGWVESPRGRALEVVVRGMKVRIHDAEGREMCSRWVNGAYSLQLWCSGPRWSWPTLIVQDPIACDPEVFLQAWAVVLRNVDAKVEPIGMQESVRGMTLECFPRDGHLTSEPGF